MGTITNILKSGYAAYAAYGAYRSTKDALTVQKATSALSMETTENRQQALGKIFSGVPGRDLMEAGLACRESNAMYFSPIGTFGGLALYAWEVYSEGFAQASVLGLTVSVAAKVLSGVARYNSVGVFEGGRFGNQGMPTRILNALF